KDAEQAWLRRSFACNLADVLRKLGTAARDVNRERSLENALEDSSAQVAAWVIAEQTSPSERADNNELLMRLAATLAVLPEDQRSAVEMHHLLGLSVAEVGERLGRTTDAAAGLVRRGLKALRQRLSDKS